MISMSESIKKEYMELAINLAIKAKGRTSPNPMVGAVIVKDNKIIGTGYHQKAGTPHAEVHALKAAGDNAKGSSLYVTLEPCSHYGRTPPCTEAIINAGVKEVYVAMVDPNPLVAGRGINQLREAGIKVESGLMEAEAKELNEIFIKYITSKKPFVLLKTAMTLDGKIATYKGDSKWITGKRARSHVHHLRDTYDGILVGIGTVLADDPSLTTRLEEFGEAKGKDPVRIIVDSEAKIPLESKVLNLKSEAITIIAFTERADKKKIEDLKNKGAQVLLCQSTPEGKVDLNSLMERLGQLEISSLLIEGGSEIAASALNCGVIDKVQWFIAPKLIGGHSAIGPVGGKGKKVMDEAIKIRDIKIMTFGEDISIEGYL